MKSLSNLKIGLKMYKFAGPYDEIDGAYTVPHYKIKDYVFQIIASTGLGWEHVSITILSHKKKNSFVERCPTWEEMCWIKDLFWNDDEVVVQYHPAKSDYINNDPHCLHLWKPIDQCLPTPDSLMVGIKVY